MDFDLSSIQAVVLTPIKPAIAFATVVGLIGGAIVALFHVGFDYQKNKQWTEKKKIAGFTVFSLATSIGLSVFVAAAQLSMAPTTSLREVVQETLNVVAIWCLVTCFSNWQVSRGRTLFGKPASAERQENN